ncbi:hypothetical protein GIB67_022232 [Kingdonia uniflora]|uniref:Uncharacterized protein n=1 Tax=Kingdonia uniflora TaxID=39325 RepID=A0A7J7M735_9MAGN|nr:hypothetical protein GIB67_022232 [Kingdonia uniflora]
MDPEQTFIRVQERFSQMLTPRLRIGLEYIYLVFALSLFGLLVVMHANFVQQPGCSSELSVAELADMQLVHIKITSIGLPPPNTTKYSVMGVPDTLPSDKDTDVSNADGDGLTFLGSKCWLSWLNPSARRGKLVLKSLKDDNEYLEVHVESSTDTSISKPVADEKEMNVDTEKSHTSLTVLVRESLKTSVIHVCTRWERRLSILQQHAKHVSRSFRLLWTLTEELKLEAQNIAGRNMLIDIPKWSRMLRLDQVNTFAVQWLEERGRSFEPTYMYTAEKGYFLLPEGAKSRHNIRTVNISISARDSCFGNRWQQLLINRFIGYDTILMNTLLSSPGQVDLRPLKMIIPFLVFGAAPFQMSMYYFLEESEQENLVYQRN